MKNPILLVGIIIVVFLAVFAVINLGNITENDPNNLTWYKDVDYAVKEAQMNNKSVMIDFYSPSCEGCGKLDEVTYKDPKVNQKLKENYILVKINLDKSPDLASKYQIISAPTILFLNANGEEIKRINGYLGPEEFINKL
jgi:thiol:disulfide interchange protein DsbD